MRFLFALRHAGYMRRFESTVRMLSDRRHEVVLVLDSAREDLEVLDAPKRLVAALAELPGVEIRRQPDGITASRTDFGAQIRAAVNYLGFLEPEFDSAPKIRARA